MCNRNRFHAVFSVVAFLFFLPCLIFSKKAVSPAAHADFVPPAGMKQVWSDEFNGPGINLSNWTYETRATGWSPTWNNEYQKYTDNGTNGPNAFISNGCLVILAERVKPFNDFNSFKSARLTTLNRQSWKFGTIAARIKMPYGNGLWPAFWMMGTNSQVTVWPNCGEIDIVEMIGGSNGMKKGGGDSAVSGALHGPGYFGNTAKSRITNIISGRLSDDFHVYSVVWTQNDITWYFDKTPYLKISSSDVMHWVFDHHYYIILNVAVGGNWPGYPDQTTEFPQAMIVDWVRVYQ